MTWAHALGLSFPSLPKAPLDPHQLSAMPGRRPVVGVMGSGSTDEAELALPLAQLLAERGVSLLTGGGAGTMESVSAAFAAVPNRSGMIIAVLPGIPAAQAGRWDARDGMEGLGGGRPVPGTNSSATVNEVRIRPTSA